MTEEEIEMRNQKDLNKPSTPAENSAQPKK